MEVQNIVQQEFLKCITHQCEIEGSSFSVEENKKDPTKLNVLIYGESNTIHQNGIYKAEFQFTKDFPEVRPEGKFISPLPYHSNIDENGKICLDYYNDWDSSTYNKKSFVILIENLCTLIHNQNNESCLRYSIGKEEQSNKQQYIQNVQKQALVCRQAFLDG
ncbi:ubiquitin-conjugating enzyme (macronuclear) [Tetrahymena thermophila SB210]|uniref:Ubiquitin-conjugating enzyme n=1 Tax=Tetrahymena thermophila (strain SB210) TaxID=312017 RepID=Q238T8_TETTS|nr:ubiquitin-conjugating enzyme [Tetrahymena thermophila SB210]EAR93132.1 ubiquitin-conjugating enzyme [Tetrahymena thermophila SB210]|eukprot:XP_001013377.1 ubiquitin-conjugating enzyme [Tetrahymena thermophila SB210]